MALPLVAVAFLMSAANVSALTDLKSITDTCKKVQASASKLHHQFLSCEPGSCSEDGTKVECKPKEVKIAVKVRLDTRELCTERCVKHSGSHSAASTSTATHKQAHKEGGKQTHHASGQDKKMNGEGKPMPKTKDATAKSDKAPTPAGSKTSADESAPLAGAGVAAGQRPTTAAVATEPVPADVATEPIPATADASTPVAADVATSQAPTAVTGCSNMVEALMKLPQATGLAEIASKVLDPESIAILTNPAANLTVFVPPQESLLKVLGGWQAGAIPQEDVATILKLHIVPEVLLAADLITFDGETLPTMAVNEELMVVLDGDKLSLMANNTVHIIEDDLDGCSDSQVIHTIDGILMPEGLDIKLDTLPKGDLNAIAAVAPAGAPSPRGVQSGGALGVVSAAAALFVTGAAVLLI